MRLLKRTAPFTSSTAWGAVVPMPTLPELDTNNLEFKPPFPPIEVWRLKDPPLRILS